MYDHLLGEIVEKHASRIVMRCGGVGYDVRVSLNSATGLKIGSPQKLFTILNVVDGMPSLLGFSTQPERELARRLLACAFDARRLPDGSCVAGGLHHT